MGILFDLCTKRNMLFERYMQIRNKKDKTREDELMMSSLVARLVILDEEIEESKGE